MDTVNKQTNITNRTRSGKTFEHSGMPGVCVRGGGGGGGTQQSWGWLVVLVVVIIIKLNYSATTTTHALLPERKLN